MRVSSKRPRSRARSGGRPSGHRAAPAPHGQGHARHAAPQFEAASFDPTPVDFATFGLDERLMRGIADRGYVLTTPVQSAVFPLVSAGGDLVGSAQTGTGKTAAFLLPIMQRLIDREGDARLKPGSTERPGSTEKPGSATRVLILAPTRELAVQIEDDFQGLAYHTSLTGVAVYGGVGADPQDRALRSGVDLVVATPGRLLDHINTTAADFSGLEVLVLDEADRMLDMGFWPDVRRIISTLPPSRQTLLFSATISEEVRRVASQIMRAPKFVQIGPSNGPATAITHVGHVMPRDHKPSWLAEFLRRCDGTTLVFVRTKRGADRLARRLEAARIRCAALHADRSQSQRSSAVEGFRSGRYTVLVATDIAARGLDIDGIAHVVNYDVPENADTYVHRVGRTGRAAASGTALTLISPEEVATARALERALDVRLTQTPRPS